MKMKFKKSEKLEPKRSTSEPKETVVSIAAIEKLHKEFSDLSHPIAIAMKNMHDIHEIRIIEGLDK